MCKLLWIAGHVVYPGSAVYSGTKFADRAIMEGEVTFRPTVGLMNATLELLLIIKELFLEIY